MPRVAQAPPPGFARNGTAEATPGRYWDGNNVRWRNSVLEPIGGSIYLPGSATADVPRDVLCWHDNNYQRWAAFGTDNALYAYSFELQQLWDITPAGTGAIQPPGAPNGYGLGLYSTGLYGMPRTPDTTPPPGIVGNLGDLWSMDTFGELLLVVPTQDGHLFVWDPTTPTTPAVLVPEAPVQNRGVIVTDQRQVVLYGAGGDPRAVAWSDQESIHVWTPDVTNLAGSKQLVTQAAALTATKLPQGVLIFTTNDVHQMTYVGPPYAYGIVQIGAGCGPLSARSVVNNGSFAVWPSWQNFWIFGGTVSPLNCDLKDWFFGVLNPSNGGLCFGSNNSQFAEIWWDWPDESSTVCNRYLAYNYGATQMTPYGAIARPIWLMGKRQRTGADRTGTMNYPVCGGIYNTGGALYQHEIGYLDDTSPRAPNGLVYAETGAIVLGEGDQRFNVTQLVFDALTLPDQPALGFQFYAKEQPFDQVENATQLYTTINPSGLMDVRFSGRTARMRVQATRDVGWELGKPRLLMQPAGTR